MKKILVMFFAGMLVLSTSAAHASQRDAQIAGALIGGLVIGAIIGSAVSESRKYRHHRRYYQPGYSYGAPSGHYRPHHRVAPRIRYHRVKCQGTNHWRQRSRCPLGQIRMIPYTQ